MPLLNGQMDVYDMCDLLEELYGEGVDIKALTDRQAKYEKVIAAFDHLKQAGPEDSVLFYFSGHGSRIKSAPEFQHLSGDGMDETLCCFDSRMEDGQEISDKELAALFSEISETCPHAVAFLDCCHSGNMLRGRVKEVTPIQKARPLDSYYGNWIPGQENDLPQRTAIVLTACNKHQYAEENTLLGRGNFTLALADAWRDKPLGSYNDLFLAMQGAILRYSKYQTPQLESYGGMPIQTQVLGHETLRSPFRFKVRHKEAREGDQFEPGWYLNLGVAHGLPLNADKVGQVELSEENHVLGSWKLSKVGLAESRIGVDETLLTKGKTYSAVLKEALLKPMYIAVGGYKEEVEEAIPRWAETGFPMLRLTREELYPRYTLGRKDGGWFIGRLDRKLILYEGLEWDGVVELLEKIYRWETLLRMPDLEEGDVHGQMRFQVLTGKGGGQQVHGKENVAVELAEGQVSDRVEIRLQNEADGKWFWYFIQLGEDYSISLADMDSFDGPSHWTRAALFGIGIHPEDPAPSATNHFKLLVSRQEIDLGNLVQEGIHPPKEVTRSASGSFSLRKWTARTFAFHSLRIAGQVGPAPLHFTDGALHISPHPTFSSSVNFSSGLPDLGACPPSRFLHDFGHPPIQWFEDKLGHFHVLEFANLSNPADLKVASLEIRVHSKLSIGTVWPLAWDGKQLYVPGKFDRWEGNEAIIQITHLKPIPTQGKWTGGRPSVQICLFKIPSNAVDFEGMDSRALESALLSL